MRNRQIDLTVIVTARMRLKYRKPSSMRRPWLCEIEDRLRSPCLLVGIAIAIGLAMGSACLEAPTLAALANFTVMDIDEYLSTLKIHASEA